jgi:tRNA A22 N-methylase
MGADTMVSILEQAKWLQCPAYRLILQCQSKTPMLRRYLSNNGWHISREKVVRDGRFLYTVMEVLFGNARELTEGQTYFSPALLADPAEDTKAYYEQVLFRLRRAVAGQKDQADPKMVQALKELEEDPIYKELQK